MDYLTNNTVLWVLQIVVAALFYKPARMKTTLTREGMQKAKQMDSPPSNTVVLMLRTLGLLEFLGMVGIILPQLIGIAPQLTSVTALCFCLVLTLAIPLHIKEKDYSKIPIILLMLGMCMIIAYGRG